MPLLSVAPPCSDLTPPLFLNPGGSWPRRWKTISNTSQWSHKFMKMLFCKLFWPQHDGAIPRGYLVTDCTICLQSKHQSAARGEPDAGVRGLSFWLRVPHSLACFVQGPGSESWKPGTFNDLQQFVFNKQWQTTSSPFPSSSPGFYLCSAFEPGLKAVALKQTRPRGSRAPDRIPSNSAISAYKTAERPEGGRRSYYSSPY